MRFTAADVKCAPETVTPEINRFPPEATEKILKSPWLPVIVRRVSPGPVIVSAPPEELMAGNPEFRVMVPVPVTPKVIVSAELSEAFESVMACRSDPAPESFVLVTWKAVALTVLAAVLTSKAAKALLKKLEESFM